VIYGVGVDLMSVARVRAVAERFGARFAARVLHPAECAELPQAKDPNVFLAKRFAVKEACAKALGLGFRGVAYRDIGLTQDRLRKPSLVFSPGLRHRIEALGIDGSHVTISDDLGMIVAVVILETGRGSPAPDPDPAAR
jgi:holo-[acyl-carrier protein] synthase